MAAGAVGDQGTDVEEPVAQRLGFTGGEHGGVAGERQAVRSASRVVAVSQAWLMVKSREGWVSRFDSYEEGRRRRSGR